MYELKVILSALLGAAALALIVRSVIGIVQTRRKLRTLRANEEE